MLVAFVSTTPVLSGLCVVNEFIEIGAGGF
jgi:hypothetical protein